ncbi:hypothetical protein Tco_0925497 [Tanacetum coccineum]|uniref:Uncharacterized protein n=1 Tax=Tanacetum coccineum TaxID=301880 RepID=A0ABQ5D7W1_9ASTR
MVGQYMQKKEEDRRITEDQAAKDRYWKIPIFYDDDEDYTIVITPVLSTEEPVNSLIMEDEHLDTIPAMESDEVIKSSVEKLVQILRKSEDQFEGFSDSKNDDLLDCAIFSIDDIDYVETSPPNSELVSLEEVKDFHTEDGEIEDDILHEKLSKINLLIAKIKAINSNPPPSSNFVTKSDFYHEEFADELAHIISPPEYDCFYFKSEPDPGELTSIVDSGIRENISSTTNVNLPFEDDQSPLLAYVVWIFLPFLTIARILKPLVLAVLSFDHSSFTSSASFGNPIS